MHSLIDVHLCLTVGPSIPPAVSYSKRAQANSVESEHKEDWDKDVSRKLSSTTVGSKGEMTASPLVGPERKKSNTAPSVSQIFCSVQCKLLNFNTCRNKQAVRNLQVIKNFGTS